VKKDDSTVGDQVTLASSSSLSGKTEEPEWLIPKQQQPQSNDINTNNYVAKNLFSNGKTSNTVTSKAPLIVNLNDNPYAFGTDDTTDITQQALLELILPLEITPSSNEAIGRKPLIEEIDDFLPDNYETNFHVEPSSNEESKPANFFMTESNVSKAASFYSTASKEPESTRNEFGGQWAECTHPLIEEVEDDNIAKTDAVNIEAIEDMEDIEAPHLYSVSGQLDNSNTPLSVSKNDTKENLSDVKTSSEGETDKIAVLAEKAVYLRPNNCGPNFNTFIKTKIPIGQLFLSLYVWIIK